MIKPDQLLDALLTGGAAQQAGVLLALHGLVTTTLARAEQFADEPYALEKTVTATLADLSTVTEVVTTYATEFEKAGKASATAEQKYGASNVRDGALVVAATVIGTSKLAYNATIGGAWEAGKNVGTAVAEYGVPVPLLQGVPGLIGTWGLLLPRPPSQTIGYV